MLRIAVCEDNLEVIKEITDFFTRHRPDCQIQSFSNGEIFWFHYQGVSAPYDLVLLDIELPGCMNGLDVGREIRALGHNVPIVLITAFEKYALEGYDIRPHGYLVKPLREDKLLGLVEELECRLKAFGGNCLTITKHSQWVRIPFEEIIYIESRKHHVYIHARDQVYDQYKKLTDLLDDCDFRFLHTHKSYAVNADYIKRISGRYNEVELVGGKTVPISQGMRPQFILNLASYDRRCGTIRA